MNGESESFLLQRGFTLVELLAVMVIVALLLTVAVPRYFHSVDRAREAVLKQDLAAMRDAIDKHFADTGAYPPTLEDLVRKKYLRAVPRDPITESAGTWIVVPPAGGTQGVTPGSVFDVKSGAESVASDGSIYKDW